jgi:hypothetical protein
MTAFRPSHVIAVAALLMTSADVPVLGTASVAADDGGTRTIQVAGSGIDLLTTAVIHLKEFTPTGMIQKSTEIVELNGDLNGRVLYHVTTVIDFAQATLVNTGEQVYSGTVAGSEPVMIHDDQFRFELNLATGEEHGRVYLLNHIAGHKVRCTLDVVGTGLTAEGNPLFDYKGTCTFRGQ